MSFIVYLDGKKHYIPSIAIEKELKKLCEKKGLKVEEVEDDE